VIIPLIRKAKPQQPRATPVVEIAELKTLTPALRRELVELAKTARKKEHRKIIENHAEPKTWLPNPDVEKLFLGAFHGNRLVGLRFTNFNNRTSPGGFEFVHPDWRRKGIGLALLNATNNVLVERGVKTIKLTGTTPGGRGVARSAVVGNNRFKLSHKIGETAFYSVDV